MHRRAILAGACALLAAPYAARAQPSGKVWRIGYLSLAAPLDNHRLWIAAFRDGLRRLGYVEGDNVVIEERYAAGRVERLPALAAELLALKVDIVVAAPAGAAAAVKEVTRTVPIVFMAEPDPVGTGLVTDFARPGGNVTGLADAHAELVPKRLELLKQIVPSLSRVGVLWNPANRSTMSQLKTVQTSAPALGLAVVPVGVKGPARDDVDRAFASIRSERLGGLVVIGDATLGSQRNRIAALAIEHRLPTSGAHAAWVEAGLLMSYGTDFVELFRYGAQQVDKVLKGAKPADLPVQQPKTFELVLNRTTAKALGVTLPESLLLRANQVIAAAPDATASPAGTRARA